MQIIQKLERPETVVDMAVSSQEWIYLILKINELIMKTFYT